jgi:predicted  nucleic acid-binding Zn-ribbon protein
LDSATIAILVTAGLAGVSALGVFVKTLFSALSKRIDVLENAHGECQEENANLREKAGNLQAENTYLRHEVQGLRDEVKELRVKVAELQRKIT